MQGINRVSETKNFKLVILTFYFGKHPSTMGANLKWCDIYQSLYGLILFWVARWGHIKRKCHFKLVSIISKRANRFYDIHVKHIEFNESIFWRYAVSIFQQTEQYGLSIWRTYAVRNCIQFMYTGIYSPSFYFRPCRPYYQWTNLKTGQI